VADRRSGGYGDRELSVIVAALALGLAVGVAVGMLGGGGSVLAVPILVYLLGQDVAAATTSSLAIVAAGAVAGSLGHHHERRVCWRHAAVFTAASVPGIFAGTVAGEAVSGRVLIGAFSVIMFAAAYATWRKASADQREPAAVAAPATACPPLRVPRDLTAGAGLGFLTGFFGVGGGFLVVPTLAIALAFTMRIAVGTSLAIIAAASLIGLATHLLAGREMDAGITVAMAAGCVAGALAGAAVAGRVPQRTLGRGFAGLVTGVAMYLLVSATVLGGPPGS
jgi:uncharacterized membrane protein YfcA